MACKARHGSGIRCEGQQHPQRSGIRDVSAGDLCAHWGYHPTGKPVEWYSQNGSMWWFGTATQIIWAPNAFVEDSTPCHAFDEKELGAA